MKYEIVIAMYIKNEQEYQRYREKMIPILNTYSGSFGFDFKVAEVLISKTDDPINRVFTIEFPSKQVMESFFTDEQYLAVKKRHFTHSVSSITTISMHQKSA